MTEVQNKAVTSMIGKKALLLNVGEDPLEVTISKIDQASGLIIEVIFVDENKERKVLEVKDKVIMYLPFAIRLILQIWPWIKGIFKKKKPAQP